MPTRPLSHAQRQGRTASDRSYDRTRRVSDPRLAEAARIRSGARWQHVRRLVLQAQPLCADPYGWHAAALHIEVATQVDHVIGLAERPDLAYTIENLQPLCFSCHSKKSTMERSGKALQHGHEVY